MASPDFPSSKSPRRELQGPRPAPLKIRKDSHKIKKPPVVPPPHHHHQQPSQPHPPPRQPVIIYTVSPKVIHTDPSEFMTLVQRLTGPSSSSCSSTFASHDPMDHDGGGGCGGAISPAARYATIEKIKPQEYGRKQQISGDPMDNMLAGFERATVGFPGILSPGPSSLPPIPSNLFLPSDPSPSFFHDLSPVLHSNRIFMEASFMPSPSNFVSPHLTSPNPPIDLFNNFLDF